MGGRAATITVDEAQLSTSYTTVVGCEGKCGPSAAGCIPSLGACYACSCGLLSSLGAGVAAAVTVRSRDAYGNAVREGGRSFGFSLRAPGVAGGAGIVAQGFADDRRDGSYGISLFVTAAGSYLLLVIPLLRLSLSLSLSRPLAFFLSSSQSL